jgi:anti-sigma B factor antagonist
MRVVEDGLNALVALAGELDIASAPAVRACLLQLDGRGRRNIVIDLADVEFIDSTSIGVLVGGLKRCRAHDGDLRLVSPSPRTFRAIELVGLLELFGLPSHRDPDA